MDLNHRMWKHVKGQDVYELLGQATLSTSHDLKDMSEVVVCRGPDNTMSVHDKDDTVSIRALVDEARMQLGKSAKVRAGDVLAVYRGGDGRLWVRPVADFFDGRFIKLGNDLLPLHDGNALVPEIRATGSQPARVADLPLGGAETPNGVPGFGAEVPDMAPVNSTPTII